MSSVSGVRGIFADTLNPAVVLRYAARFGELQKSSNPRPMIVVGRDSRTTGIAVQHAVISALISVGCDVMEIGIVSTPTVLLCVKDHQAAGGIAITASHNPPEWNAMKFVDNDGMFLSPERASLFLSSVNEDITWADWENIGTLIRYKHAIDDHIDAILKIPYLNIDQIK
ncbi:MAG: phosphoglucosamine mutase, partial [Candidatus Cloacimonadaceae bacterium]|nr:phosphoglucosamine mutase [Candidatus Cloacimonadaceae bacterium]